MILMVFLTILTMLIYALPGFLLTKFRLVSDDAPKIITVILLYVLQPCLTVASFQKVTFTRELIKNYAVCFFISLFLIGSFILIFRVILRKRSGNVTTRVFNVAVAFSNASFIGIPLLEVILPECKEAASYSAIFFLTMSVLGWTVASSIITMDKKYISIKKILINPAIFGIIAAVILGVIDIKFGWKIPSPFSDMVSLLGKMTTPFCMLAMGFRLAQVDLKKMFTTPLHYAALFFKLIVFPLFVFAVTKIIPIDESLKICLFVMSCCPVAAVVQSFAELVGEGQESAADMVLLSSVACIGTIPLMLLLL